MESSSPDSVLADSELPSKTVTPCWGQRIDRLGLLEG